MKRAYFFILLALLLVFPMVGCNSAGETSGIDDSINNKSTKSTLASVSQPYYLEVSFPDGAPALNQVTQLEVIAVAASRILNGVQIDIILPEGLVLVNGSLSWAADNLPDGETKVITTQVKSIKTGNWEIEARMQWFEEGVSVPNREGKYPIYISVTEESAEWGINPPWQGQTPLQLEIHPPTEEPPSDNTITPTSVPTITITIPSGPNPPSTIPPDENLPQPPAITP